ncbi:hypothetical protein BH10BAC6_BH10BAC6_06060 [soil metagenome]
MTQKQLGIRVMIYGLFLVVCGLFGYALTGETSTSSLVNGGIFGTLVIALGFLLRQGRMWTFPASLSAVGIFTLTFIWRGVIQVRAIADGASGHLGVGILVIVMFLVSVLMFVTLFRSYRH